MYFAIVISRGLSASRLVRVASSNNFLVLRQHGLLNLSRFGIGGKSEISMAPVSLLLAGNETNNPMVLSMTLISRIIKSCRKQWSRRL
jgi:hypothetical protein